MQLQALTQQLITSIQKKPFDIAAAAVAAAVVVGGGWQPYQTWQRARINSFLFQVRFVGESYKKKMPQLFAVT